VAGQRPPLQFNAARNVRLSRELRSSWPHDSDKERPGGT
jgi:hypothetical protein